MQTLKALKQIAEKKGLSYEINKYDYTLGSFETNVTPNPDTMKIQIGIEYRRDTYAWFESFVDKNMEDNELEMGFVQTYNRNCGRADKRAIRGIRVLNSLFK